MVDLKSGSTRNLQQYRELHLAHPGYGKSSRHLVDFIARAIRAGQDADPSWKPATILDFGCGKSRAVDGVAEKLGLTPYRYDPAIEGIDVLPVTQADVVMNTDVLEHLDQNEVDLLLTDVKALSGRVFFHIATAPAGKDLPSGENAHATVQPTAWWAARLKEHFPTVTELPAAPNRASFVTWAVPEKAMRGLLVTHHWSRKERMAAAKAWLGMA